MLLTPAELRSVFVAPSYSAAGDPAPAAIVVRVESGAPGARFYLTDGAVDITDPRRVELTMQPNQSWYARYVAPAGPFPSGVGRLWAVSALGDDRTTLDNAVLTSASAAYAFGQNGKLRLLSSVPGWVAPVVVVGVLGAIGAAVLANRAD